VLRVVTIVTCGGEWGHCFCLIRKRKLKIHKALRTTRGAGGANHGI
jgi:hypothetical protein